MRLAQISLSLLLVIVIRTLGEILRLTYAAGGPLSAARVAPYVTGAAAAAVAALAVAPMHFSGRDRSAVSLTFATIAGLIVYKTVVMGL
jgi:hypothetical protein